MSYDSLTTKQEKNPMIQDASSKPETSGEKGREEGVKLNR